MHNYRITGQARNAGRNVLHTVSLDGDVIAERRSAHRYDYAICRWATVDGDHTVIAQRWSRSPKCSSASFAVPLTYLAEKEE